MAKAVFRYTSLPCFCGCRIGGACSRLAISTCRDRQRQGRSDHALDRLRLPPTHLEIPPLNWVPINGCITSAERLSLIVCTPVRRESFGRCASISSARFAAFHPRLLRQTSSTGSRQWQRIGRRRTESYDSP